MSEGFEVKRVKELLKVKEPITIGPEASLREAAKKMADHGIGFLPVVDEKGDLVGVISERDITYSFGNGKENSKVKDVMRTNIITVNENDTVAYAARLLSEHGIRHLVVVNDEGKLVGVFSIKDLTYGEGALFSIIF